MATQPDKIDNGALATIVVVGTFAVLGIALAVTALVRAEVQRVSETSSEDSNRTVRELKAEHLGELTAQAAYVDQSKGIVSIPIDRAMELEVQDLKKNPYAASPGAKPDAETADAGAAEGASPNGGDAAAEQTDAGLEPEEADSNKETSSEQGGGAEQTEPPAHSTTEAVASDGAGKKKLKPKAPQIAPKQQPAAPAPSQTAPAQKPKAAAPSGGTASAPATPTPKGAKEPGAKTIATANQPAPAPKPPSTSPPTNQSPTSP